MLIESFMIKLLIASVYFVLGKPLFFFNDPVGATQEPSKNVDTPIH